MQRLAEEMERRIEDEGAKAAESTQQGRSAGSSNDVDEQSGGMPQGSDELPRDANQEEDMDDEDARDNDADDVVMAVSGGPPKEGTRRNRMRWDDGQRAMQEQLDRYGAGHNVTEIYSPPRVTRWASRV